MRPHVSRLSKRAALFLLLNVSPLLRSAPTQQDAEWPSASGFRVWLRCELRGPHCSGSPASVEIDFQKLLQGQQAAGTFDETTVEVMASPPAPHRVPHRLDRLFGTSRTIVHFVVPDRSQTNVAIYFDTWESRRSRPKSYPGLIGDGDKFSEEHKRREIAPSHFDCFVDFDGDGDLDLFQGGVEPFVYCRENVGGNRLVDRGRLASDGKLFTLPCSKANRSWLTVAFHDVDGDGDQDFFPSFGDGPDAGKIVFYRNTTKKPGGQLTFERVGPLHTASGVTLAGGTQAGGWFPSIVFLRDWDRDGLGPDALVGSNHRCWLYRGLSALHEVRPLSSSSREADEEEHRALMFADAVAVQAGGKDIELINPRFDCADIDNDGDIDLFAGTQPGAVHWFENIGTRARCQLAPGKVIAWGGKYLIGDAHSGVRIADFDGDGLLDIVTGRFWERADLNLPDAPHDYGGFWRNIGNRTSPRFIRRTRRAPFTERFQTCDAIRQNCVRAVDWDGDGERDLLAGDTDGFIWFFKNLRRGGRRGDARAELRNPKSEIRGGQRLPAAGTEWSVFATGEKLRVAGGPLGVAATGGHARFDVCDWNNDGRKDLVVADGSGTLTVFLDRGGRSKPSLADGRRLSAGGQPIQLGSRASVLVCDWDNDGREDLLLADDKGYYFSRNTSAAGAPVLAAPRPVIFGGRRVSYVRPNLGAFVDWDGDGKRDLIGCHFENSIRFYRNVGSGMPGVEPRFTDPEGLVILQVESPQMISGADAVDWNGDGDLDLLTGQGHGGSGLRFYERDWLENALHDTHPLVTIQQVERKPGR